ncbi:MAG TPA: response regulator [Vicinamibacterales bacterium]|nr:response regulator [Vicinamibacterales bacterium]
MAVPLNAVERKPPDAVVGPFEGSTAPDADRNSPTVVADGRVNILIVDDEPANLKVLEAILDDPGYRLVRAGSANDALMSLVSEDFGLLILDIRMPDMSGFELAHLIKQRKKSAAVPIIFLTAFYNEDQDVVAGYGTGAVDYLHKPVNATVLRSKVAVFVELHRKSRELVMANRALLLEVTERRRAEEQLRELNESLDRRVTERSEALRESEQRFRTMADQTPMMMWVTSPSGVVEFVNKEYCSFFGVSPEESTQSGWRMPLHEDDSSYLRALFEALRTRRPFQSDARMRRADGEWRWMMSNGAPRTSPSGEFLGMIVTSHDVTDQRHAATMQQQIARAKDEFIAVLAHELRSPLAPIRTSVGILRAHATHPLIVRCGDIIDRQTAHMARLLDDLLDTSRLSRNTLTLQRARVRLGEVLQSAMEIASPLIDQQRLELEVDGLDEPVWLDADHARLTQVFGNLLNNAAKYSKPGGRVNLMVRPAPGWVVVSVRDSGIGIAPDMLDRVFEPFTQATMARDHAPGGVGIGLSLAHRLVEMHGGSIQAVSDGPGFGSEFVVRLPVCPDDVVVQERPVAPAVTDAPLPRRVLVADDNVDSADMEAALLSAVGCEVRTVYDGESTLREAERFRPDVVLLDIGMPDIDGHEVCARIRSQSWGGNIVLIAVSGWGQEGDRRRSARAGFNMHLVKPVDPDALLRIVRDVMSQSA